MERKEILRTDFPSARRGYDRDAVDAHLRKLADQVDLLQGQQEGGLGLTSLAEMASEKVTGVIRAAEQAAAQLEAEARAQAAARIERAEQAVAGLLDEAEALRERVAALGREVSVSGETRAEVEPQGPPTPAESPAPPAPGVDPQPAEVPEPEPPDESPPGPEPVPEPVPMPDHPEEPPPAAGVSGNGDAGARLVALNMALDGSSREDVERHLASRFGIDDASKLLDDVFARAAR